MQDEHQESDLLDNARRGDEAALRILFLRNHDRLLAKVRAAFPADLRSVSDQEDVLQVTYADATDAIHRFHPSESEEFYHWIAKIAERNLTDLIRFHRAAKRDGRRNRQNNLSTSLNSDQAWYDFLAAESLTPSLAVAKDEAIAALRLALADLKPDYREVIELRYLKQLSEADTAKQMGRDLGTIHGLCFRATRKLRERMGRYSRYFSNG